VAIAVDLELTNRCNASCHFCPRDQTPHQGLMSPEVFTKALERAVELRAEYQAEQEFEVSLCGLGEPLLNKHAPEFVRQVRAAGFTCNMSSNAALLDERRARSLLDAGLQCILINASEQGEEYDDIYKLPFEKTRDNVVRFLEMSDGACEVRIVLVDHRYDKKHLAEMRRFWEDLGVRRFVTYDVINRGGALFVDHMQYEQYSEIDEARAMLSERGTPKPICAAPFLSLTVGYDGQYYLCCSDWKKEAPLGSVFDETFQSVARAKLEHILTREPVCKTCNLDPINRLTEELRAVKDGLTTPAEVDVLLDEIVTSSATMRVALDDWLSRESARPRSKTRGPSIPVQTA
jgi:MoaA/NifB/PqqE/SkfB family radical SAM enzyme